MNFTLTICELLPLRGIPFSLRFRERGGEDEYAEASDVVLLSYGAKRMK